MSSENKRTDEYWMGVRDALRMVDSFNKWASRNPSRAKNLDDFIHDGLIAAAKRCESCLREKLGLSFVKEEQAEQIHVSVETYESDAATEYDAEPAIEESFDVHTESPPDTDFEVAVESADYFSDQEISVESEEPSVSIDSVERFDEQPMDDIVIEGPQRDFSTDFVLVEPSPLSVDTEESEPRAPEIDEPLGEPDLDELEHIGELTPDPVDAKKKSVFTWSDYEAAVTPTPEPEPPESDFDEPTSVHDEYKESSFEGKYSPDDVSFIEPSEPSEATKDWTDDDESSILDEKNTGEFDGDAVNEVFKTDFEDSEASESSEEAAPITEPPSPPPPPESEEDEEERRRRARRLFFGA